MKKRILGIAAVAAALVLALGVLAGCGGSGSGSAASGSASGSASTSGSGAVYRTLDDIKASGKLVIGVFSDKNPFGYVD